MQRADFCEPSGGEHRVSARVDARVERGARRQQADFDDFVALQRVAAAAMDFAHRFSGEQAQFDGADNFLHVGGGNARGRFRIETREHAMQMRGAVLFGPLPQARANFLGALRGGGEPFEERAQIQACACSEDRRNLARAQVVQSFQRAATEISRGENFVRFDDVHQVMRNALLLGRGNFRGADIEMAIYLGRVADQYFAAEFFGEMDAQRGLAGSGGAEDDDEPRQSAHPENFQ